MADGQELLALKREKRTRREAAYVIRDAITGTLLLTQKLKLAAYFINVHLARAPRERVTVSSLFEAADQDANRLNGYHKMRYHISRCSLGTAHHVFNAARVDGTSAVVLTGSPECYAVA